MRRVGAGSDNNKLTTGLAWGWWFFRVWEGGGWGANDDFQGRMLGAMSGAAASRLG